MAWTDVELRHLQAFLAVYDVRSFGRAAERLGYSQAAVSQQISTLERVAGARLFERPGGPRPVVPTDAAEELLPHARTVFDELNRAEIKLSEVEEGTRGRLVIGSFESVSSSFLPTVVARLTIERPDVSLELVEEIHDHRPLIDRVISGELDASFVPTPVEHPQLRSIELLNDPYLAVFPTVWAPRFGLDLDSGADVGERLPTVDLEAVGRSPMVGHVDQDACQATVNLALRAVGQTPRYVFRSSDNGTLQAMVRARLGVAVMPLLSVDTDDADIIVAHTEPAVPRRTITLVVRTGDLRSAALAGFVEIVEQVAVEQRGRLEV